MKQRIAWVAVVISTLSLAGCDSKRSTPPLTAAPGAPAPAAPAAPAAEPEMARERADVGAGEKGRGVGEGLIITPLKTYFRAQEMIAFMIAIPKALEAYQLENDGRKPATHDEFMEKVIKANQIELPTLPAGHRYVYDPETGELMVEHPK